MAKREKTVCDLLGEVSDALYYIGVEVKPPEVYYERYENLYHQVEELKRKLGCPASKRYGMRAHAGLKKEKNGVLTLLLEPSTPVLRI